MRTSGSVFPRCAALLVAWIVLLAAPSCAAADMRLGTNLSAVNYYSSEWVFTDVMKMAKPWMTRREGRATGNTRKESQVPRDREGWPTLLPFTADDGTRHFVHTMLPCFQSGRWTLKVEGQGLLRVRGPGVRTRALTLSGRGEKTFTFDFTGVTFNASPYQTDAYPYIYIEIMNSDGRDRVRNLRMLMPGHADERRVFHPEFVRRLEPFSVLRFMDWGNTNHSGVEGWGDRTRAEWYTQGANGVAYEWMVRLCNETDKDLWVCVPHRATDDHVRRLARLLRDGVEPGRKVYVEYSNEAWNTMFSQNAWLRANVSGDNAPRRYGRRAKRVLEIFHNEFARDVRRGKPAQRLVRVLAGQAANPWVIEEAYAAARESVDAIAIAPYFGSSLTPAEIARGVPSVPRLLGDMTYNRLAIVRDRVRRHRALAAKWGVKLLCYEGGQHYRGEDGAENNTLLTRRLAEANRHPLMRDIYRWKYLPGLEAEGVELFCHFTSTSKATKWGAWGALEHQDQPIGTNGGTLTRTGDAIKWWALRDFARNH